jgi:hypothetical protein
LVDHADLVYTTGPVMEDDDAHYDQDMSNTEPDTDDDDNADARSRIFKVQDPDYDNFRPLFGWMNTKTIKKTLDQTTQYTRMPNSTILKKHCKSPFPAINVQHRNERVTRDTIYYNAPDIDGGETCAQIFVDMETLVTDGYGMKTEKQFVNTLEDNIRERGALSQFLSDRTQVEISVCVVGIFRVLHIGQWQISEPHQQHQNPCERRYQTLKTMMPTRLDRSGSSGYTWLLCLLYFAVLLQLTYNWTLGGIPLQCAEGSTRDKSLTIILHRSNLLSSKKSSNPNLCLDPLDGENLSQSPRIVKSVQDNAEDISDQVKPMFTLIQEIMSGKHS